MSLDRRGPLLHAGLAAVLIAVLLGGLEALDRDDGKPAPQPAPTKIAPAASPADAPTATSAPGAAPAPAGDATPAGGASGTASSPPSSAVSNPNAEASPPGAGPEAATAAPPAGAKPPDTEPAASGSPAPPPPAAARPAPPPAGYYLPLGEFAAPADAERVRAELAAQGTEAYLESRVVVGPFPTRKDAEAARKRLRDEGRPAGAPLPPRKP